MRRSVLAAKAGATKQRLSNAINLAAANARALSGFAVSWIIDLVLGELDENGSMIQKC